MTIEQTLLQEIEDSKRWFKSEKNESTYKGDLAKRIELIIWVLENMKDSDVQICDLIESIMNIIILKINQTGSTFEADPLHSELRILDWIFYLLCCKQ